MVYYICRIIFLHVCLGKIFILDSHLAILGEEIVLFGFLLVVF